jgi:hypothetical protein
VCASAAPDWQVVAGLQEKNGKQPTIRDVQATRIQWLEERWNEYFELKAQLVKESPKLRIYLAQEAVDEQVRGSGAPARTLCWLLSQLS